MEGWIDLGYPAVHQPRFELAGSRSQVRYPNHYSTERRLVVVAGRTAVVGCLLLPSELCQSLMRVSGPICRIALRHFRFPVTPHDFPFQTFIPLICPIGQRVDFSVETFVHSLAGLVNHATMNIAMKFAGYVVWILLCRPVNLAKNLTTFPEISNFS